MAGRSYWSDWHADYDDPGSGLSRRLSWVRDRLRVALDEAPPGPVRLISLCAGQARDVLGVLPGHPRRRDVAARLVELDPRNTEIAARFAAEAGLPTGTGPGRSGSSPGTPPRPASTRISSRLTWCWPAACSAT